MSVSTVIFTKNEEQDLPGCLQSVGWCDDIHVFDSQSADNTVRIAESHGANVASRAFDGYASQKNAALSSLPFKHDWVLLLDADERVPGVLADEIRAFASAAKDSVVAARIRRRDFLFNTWLRRAQISPWYIRLVRPGRVHFEREINEVLIPHGEVGELAEAFDHFPFSKGFAHWFEKHNRYSTMEAQRALEERRDAVPFSWAKALRGEDFHERRYHQKGLFFRLPARPVLKFCYMMFIRGAVLDGRAGWTYSLLQGIYEYMIVLKEAEHRENAFGTTLQG